MKDPNVFLNEGSEHTSSSLLERVQAQDQDAWARLVKLYSPLIYRWCIQAGLQEADAQNVGQEVFRAVFRAIKDYRQGDHSASFRGWLRTITKNKIVDFHRRQRPDTMAEGGSDAQAVLHSVPAHEDPGSSAASEANERLLLLRQAVDLILADCEEHTRQIFYRIVLDGQPVAEVAKELGVTPNVVYIAKSRLLSRLRGEFAHLLEPVDAPANPDE